MLRSVFLNPILIAVTIGAGILFCRMLGVNAHVHEMALAGIVFCIAAELSLVPLFFQSRPTALSLTQASLIGMVMHLLIAVVLAIAIILATQPTAAFAYWTLLFYWVTLCGLAYVFISAVRSINTARAPE